MGKHIKKRKIKSVLDRFNEKWIESETILSPNVDTPCHLWIAGKSEHGYGQFWNENRSYPAHRIIWELVNGPIPEEMCVLHLCDNRCCVNPEHFFLGTTQENTQDRQQKNRQAKGVFQGSSKLTDIEVIEIRQKYANGGITQKELSMEYNVHISIISLIINRQLWTHI